MTPNDRAETGVCRPLEKRYRCPSCWQRFYFKPNLDYHMQRKHGTGQQPATLSEFVHAPDHMREHIGNEVAQRVDARMAQPGSGEARRFIVQLVNYGADADLVQVGGPCRIQAVTDEPEYTVVLAADFDRLQSALTAAQQRIAELTNELNMGELRYVGTDYAKREAELREALVGMVEVFAKPHNETLHEVIAARRALTAAQQRIADLESGDDIAEATDILKHCIGDNAAWDERRHDFIEAQDPTWRTT